MTMDALFRHALRNMEAVFRVLEKRVPRPKRIPFADSFVFRHVERTIQQALVQKLARVVSGLHAARILLRYGFVQEQGALQRMLDEFQEDIMFLAYAVISDDLTELHEEYLSAFYEEEFDKSGSPVESTQKRPMVPRRKIRAYIARMEGTGLNPSRGIELSRTLHKTYSGFVHGASPHITELYGGYPPRFHVAGMLGTPLIPTYEDDLWNYFYRGIIAFQVTAMALGDDALCDKIRRYRDEFAKAMGENYTETKG